MTKIMLVEDDNNLREIYEARLAAEGYEIVAAQNGEEALAMASKERPDLIISDVMMPKISGFEMLDILRNTEALRNVKIIMLTALGQAEDSQRANSLGADRYLVKSQVTLEDIVKAAHELLDDTGDMSNAPAAPAAAAEPTADETPVAATVELPTPPAAPEVPVPPAPVEPAPQAALEPVQPEPTFTPEPVAEPPVETPAAPELPVAPAPPAAPQFSEPADDSVPTDIISSMPVDSPLPPTPTPPAPVISIPVTDAADPAAAGAAQSDDTATTTSSGMPVVEPLTTDDAAFDDATSEASLPVVEPPADDTTDDTVTTDGTTTPATDYTSSDTFSTVQTPDTNTVTSSEAPSVDPQSTADEEASMQAQIDNFISNTDSTPPESPATSDVSDTDSQVVTPPADESSVISPDTIGDPASSPVVTEPSSPDDTTNTASLAPIETTKLDPADELLQPESLDTYQAPVILASDSVTAPTEPVADTPEVPVDQSASADAVASTETPEAAPAEDTAQSYDDNLVASAANDLSTSVTEENIVAPSSSTRTRVIEPLPQPEKPSIHQLLELEEAKNAASQAAQSAQPQVPNVDAYNPSVQPAPQPTNPQEPGEDPNSIAL